jgi:PAS domain S-box-containing protein
VTTDDQGKAVKMLGTAQDVTERKLAEQSLRASQESLQRIVEGSLDMIIVSNKNRKIVLFNKAAEKIFQYKRDEVLGKDTQFLFAALGEREKIHEVMMANDRFVGEILNKKKNGDIFPTFLSASVLRDEHGEVVGHMGVSRDISDQKQAEASLSASREAFSRVVEGSLDIIISVDPSRKITLFNPAAEKAFGFRADEVLGGTVQVLYADMKDYEAVSVALRTKYQFVGEVMNLRKDGTMFPSFLSASSLRDREGNVIGSMGISRDITEQKRSEAKFRGLLESAPDAMVIVDGKGEIVIVNSQVERLFGYHRDELIGKKVELLIPERFQGRHARHRSGYSHEPRGRAMGVGLDLYARRRDGSEFPVEVSLGPLETDEGMLVMSAIRDTTERRKVESALRESDERFRAMVEGVKDYALIMVDPSGKVLNWNAGAERIHGYQEEEIVGKSIYAFYLPEDRQRAKPMRGLELAEAEGRFEDECWHVRKDGSRYWANVIVTPLRSDGGALRGFSKITRDITDRKRAEKKFRDLLESAPDAMLIIDGKGSIVLVNSQTEKLFGYKRDELIGVSPETLVSGLLHLNLSRAKGSILRKTASGSSAVVELTGKKSDGSQFPVEISLSPLETDEGILVSTAIRDITSRKLAEQQAREVFKREILLKEIHHRVKNNLQIVSSMLNLQSEYFRDPRTVELLAESQNRIRSISLIHDMLYRSNDLSRVNLGEYIESLTAHLVRSFGNERSKIDLRIRAENIVLGLDTAIPCGLIINELVSNSLKYAFPDGRKGLITVDLESQDGGTYALAVRDNGVGFPAGLDFRKTTTLGLQLVGMFVEQLDGVMSMHNKQGTEFRITFKELRYEERS